MQMLIKKYRSLKKRIVCEAIRFCQKKCSSSDDLQIQKDSRRAQYQKDSDTQGISSSEYLFEFVKIVLFSIKKFLNIHKDCFAWQSASSFAPGHESFILNHYAINVILCASSFSSHVCNIVGNGNFRSMAIIFALSQISTY